MTRKKIQYPTLINCIHHWNLKECLFSTWAKVHAYALFSNLGKDLVMASFLLSEEVFCVLWVSELNCICCLYSHGSGNSGGENDSLLCSLHMKPENIPPPCEEKVLWTPCKQDELKLRAKNLWDCRQVSTVGGCCPWEVALLPHRESTCSTQAMN